MEKLFMCGRFYVLINILSFMMVRVYGQDTGTTRHLTFDESIQIALTNSTTVLKGMNTVELTGAQVLAAHGQFLPDAVAGGSYSYTAGNNFFTAAAPTLVNAQRTNLNYQVTTNINLYNGYANRSSLKAALLSKEVAEFSLTRAQQQVRLDITQSYLQVMLDREIVAFAQQNLLTSKKREEQLNELVNVGRRPKSDLFQQQAQTSIDQQFLTNSVNKLTIDKILLLQRLRLDPLQNYEFDSVAIDESPLGVEFTSEQTLIELAKNQRADLKSSQRSQEAALWYIKRNRGGYLPKVFLTAGAFGTAASYSRLYINGADVLPNYTPQRSLGTQLGEQIYGAAALNVGWNIFDKYVTKSNMMNARINASNARIDLENVSLQIVAEIRQALGNYSTAVQQVETSQKGLVAANQAFETLSGRYSVGAANFIELSNAQNNLLLAKQNRAQAGISLFLQKRVIDFYLGGN
ncbi:TolC family protein [soil metagenome]